MGYSLGVDLGTTFVAAAVAYPSRVETFTLGDRTVVTPSVVYLREDGVIVTSEAANRRSVSNPDRVGREFKRRIGDPTPVMLGGTPHAVTDLLAAVLRDVLTRVTQTEGQRPERVVLTHPANWGPFRRGLFEQVPSSVGLDDALMTTEPEAAAAHYAATRDLDEGDIVAVYDLGGGTFDATVLRKRKDGVEILGTPEGIERLGGVDFDEAILNFVNYASGGALSDLDMRDPQTITALARLRQDCVLAKEALSIDDETILPLFLPGRHLNVTITREEFEGLIRAPIESTIQALVRTLRSTGVTPDELTAVLLVGGSSRIPLVARMVSEELGRPIVIDTHPKYAVALGAATLARVAATGRAVDSVPGLGEMSGRDVAGRDVAARDVAGRDVAGRDVAGRDVAGRDVAGPNGHGPRMRPGRAGVAPTAAAGAAAGVGAAAAAGVAAGSVEAEAEPSDVESAAVVPADAESVDVASTDAESDVVAEPEVVSADAEPVGDPAAREETVPDEHPQASGPATIAATTLAVGAAEGVAASKPKQEERPAPRPDDRPAPQTPAAAATAEPAPRAPLTAPTEAPAASAAPPQPAPPQPAVSPPAAIRTPPPPQPAPPQPAISPARPEPPPARPEPPPVRPAPPTARPERPAPHRSQPARATAPSGPPGPQHHRPQPPPPGSQPPAYQPSPAQPTIAGLSPKLVAIASAVVILLSVGLAGMALGWFGGSPAPEPPASAPAGPIAVKPSVPIPSLGPAIPVGATPGFGAMSPNGRQLYVANRGAKVVTVVDTAVNQVVATIPVDAGPPQFLTFAPDGKRVYVSIFNPERTIAAVAVLDTTTNKIVSTIPVRTRPFVADVTKDGRYLWVPNHDSGTISVIDTASMAVIREIKVAPNPHWLSFSKDGSRAYTANHESNLISVLDTATDAVLAQVPVGTSPHSLAVNPDRPLVANVNYDGGSVSCIDTDTNTVIATIPVGKNPQEITWAPDGRHAYVANVGDGTVSVISRDEARVTATIPTGRSPTSVSVTPDGNYAYVTNLDSGTLTVLNIGG